MADRGRTSGEGAAVRAVRVVVAWVLLALVALVAWGYVGEYRDVTGGGEAPAGESTSTAEPGDASETETGGAPADVAGDRPYVTVLTEGLNMRSEPITTASVIKTLAEGQQLTLIEIGTGWYHVRDAAGDEGWVAAGGRYTELVE
jgi:hypothetical protein